MLQTHAEASLSSLSSNRSVIVYLISGRTTSDPRSYSFLFSHHSRHRYNLLSTRYTHYIRQESKKQSRCIKMTMTGKGVYNFDSQILLNHNLKQNSVLGFHLYLHLSEIFLQNLSEHALYLKLLSVIKLWHHKRTEKIFCEIFSCKM